MFVALNLGLYVSAQTVDNQLIDAENTDVQQSLQFKQFNSCKDIDTVLEDYIDLYKENPDMNYYGR